MKKDLGKILRESDDRVSELFERQDPSRPSPPKESPRAKSIASRIRAIPLPTPSDREAQQKESNTADQNERLRTFIMELAPGANILSSAMKFIKKSLADHEAIVKAGNELAMALNNCMSQIKALCSKDDVPDGAVEALAAWKLAKGGTHGRSGRIY